MSDGATIEVETRSKLLQTSEHDEADEKRKAETEAIQRSERMEEERREAERREKERLDEERRIEEEEEQRRIEEEEQRRKEEERRIEDERRKEEEEERRRKEEEERIEEERIEEERIEEERRREEEERLGAERIAEEARLEEERKAEEEDEEKREAERIEEEAKKEKRNLKKVERSRAKHGFALYAREFLLSYKEGVVEVGEIMVPGGFIKPVDEDRGPLDGKDQKMKKEKKEKTRDKIRDAPAPLLKTGEWQKSLLAEKDNEDAVIIRKMKGILNKLTEAKFDKLYADLLQSLEK